MVSSIVKYYIFLPINILSILGCLFVIVFYLFFKSPRLYALKLVAWVAFFDLLKSVYFIIPFSSLDSSGKLCESLAFLLIFATTGGILWTFSISVSIYQSSVLKIANLDKYYKFWVFSILLLSILVSVIPAITNEYGFDYGFCAIKYSSFGRRIFIIIINVPDLLAVTCTSLLSLRTFWVVKNEQFEENFHEISPKKILCFPLALIICLFPMFLMKLFEMWDERSDVLFILSNALFMFHGFVNAVMYGCTKPVFQYLAYLWRGEPKEGLRFSTFLEIALS